MIRAEPAVAALAEAVGARLRETAAAEGDDVERPPAPLDAPTSDPLAEATLRADEAFAALEFVDAIRTLEAALAALEDAPVTSASTLISAWLLLSMARAASGDEAGAETAARAALAIAPGVVIDPAEYPPTLATRIDALRGEVTTCAARLSLDPSDARVAIDGAPAAAVPATLPCGDHWVTASRRGYAPHARRVHLDPRETAPVVLTLAVDPAGALASLGPPGTSVDPLAERAAAALGRELWVLDVIQEDGEHLRASLATRSVRVSRTSTPDDIARALLAPLDEGPDVVAIGVGVGVGVAVAAALAIGLAVALGSPAPRGWSGTGEIIVP